MDIKNQTTIQDIINNITNRFLSLEELNLSFSIAARQEYFDYIKGYTPKLDTQILDFKKIAKLKKLKNLYVQQFGESFIHSV